MFAMGNLGYRKDREGQAIRKGCGYIIADLIVPTGQPCSIHWASKFCLWTPGIPSIHRGGKAILWRMQVFELFGALEQPLTTNKNVLIPLALALLYHREHTLRDKRRKKEGQCSANDIEAFGYNKKELQRIQNIIAEHSELLREAWNEHFAH
jgi:hypothetical protein